METIICHYPAGGDCQHCRNNVRHAHQWNSPYPQWYGEILPNEPGAEGLISWDDDELGRGTDGEGDRDQKLDR